MRYAALAALAGMVAIGFLAAAPAAAQEPVQSATERRRGVGRCRACRTGGRICRATGPPRPSRRWNGPTISPTRNSLRRRSGPRCRDTLTAEGVDPSAREILTIIDINDREELERYKYQGNRTPEERHHIHYDNEIWLRTPTPKGLSSRRTSLITYPRNGKFPPLTPKAAARAAAVSAARAHPSAFDSYATRPLSERCYTWGHEGPPMMPPSYNDIHQIFQTPDHIVVFTELANNPPRIVPLDGRPHISEKIGQFPGDSRGRWEGRYAGRRDPQL